MVAWIGNEQVRSALETGDLAALDASGCRYCISNDGKACVVIRKHYAWHVEGEGWYEQNAAPSGNETGRDMLNFFTAPSDEEPGRWFKCFMPQDLQVIGLASKGAFYELQTNGSVHRASFKRIPRHMWNLVTGKGQREEDVVSMFEAIWEDT